MNLQRRAVLFIASSFQTQGGLNYQQNKKNQLIQYTNWIKLIEK